MLSQQQKDKKPAKKRPQTGVKRQKDSKPLQPSNSHKQMR